AGGVRSLVEEDVEAGLVEDGDAEGLGLGRLRPGVVAADHEVGLLRHRARRLRAAGDQGLVRLVAGDVGGRPGDVGAQPGQRLRAGVVDLLGEPDTGLAPLADDLAVPVDGEPLPYRTRDGRADAL